MEDDDYDDDFDDFEEEDEPILSTPPPKTVPNILTKVEEKKGDTHKSSSSNDHYSQRNERLNEEKEKDLSSGETVSSLNSAISQSKSERRNHEQRVKVGNAKDDMQGGIAKQSSECVLQKENHLGKNKFEGDTRLRSSGGSSDAGAERVGTLITKNIKKISQHKHFHPHVGVQTEFIDTKDQSHQVTCLGDDTDFVNAISRVQRSTLLRKKDPDDNRSHQKKKFQQAIQKAKEEEENNNEFLISFLRKFSPVCEILLNENVAFCEYEKTLELEQQQQLMYKSSGNTLNDREKVMQKGVPHEEAKNAYVSAPLQRNDWRSISSSFSNKREQWHQLIQDSSCGRWNQGRYISDIIFNPYHPHCLISIHTPINPLDLGNSMSTHINIDSANNSNSQYTNKNKSRRRESLSYEKQNEAEKLIEEGKEAHNQKDSSYFPEKDIIAVWDVGELSIVNERGQNRIHENQRAPSSTYNPKLKKLLFGDGRITTVCFGPGFQTHIIIAGTQDGTLLIFDLCNRRTHNAFNGKGTSTSAGSTIDMEYSDSLEKLFFGCQFSNKLKFEILFPSYTTTSNVDSIGHYSSIVSVIPLISAGIDPTLIKASEFSFLSMDDRGIISFWKISTLLCSTSADEEELLSFSRNIDENTAMNRSRDQYENGRGKQNSFSPGARGETGRGREQSNFSKLSIQGDEGGDYIGISPCSRIKLQLTRSIDLTHAFSQDNLNNDNHKQIKLLEKEILDSNCLFRGAKKRQYQKYKKNLNDSNLNSKNCPGFTGSRKALLDIHFHDMNEVQWEIPINDFTHIDAVGPLTTTILPFPHDPSRILIGLYDGSILHRSRFGERVFPNIYSKCDYMNQSDFQFSESFLNAPAAVIDIVPNLRIQQLFLVGYLNGTVALFSENFALPLKTWNYMDFITSSNLKGGKSSQRKKSQQEKQRELRNSLDYRNIAVKQLRWSPHRPGVFYVLFSNSSIIYVMDLLFDIYENVSSITMEEEESMPGPDPIVTFALSNPTSTHQSTGQRPLIAISTPTTLKYHSLEKIFYHPVENETKRLEALIANSSSFHLKTPETTLYE